MGMGEAASGDPGRMGGQSKEPCTRGTGGGSAFGRGMGGYPRPGPGGKLPPLNPEEGKTGVDLEGIKVGPHRSWRLSELSGEGRGECGNVWKCPEENRNRKAADESAGCRVGAGLRACGGSGHRAGVFSRAPGSSSSGVETPDGRAGVGLGVRRTGLAEGQDIKHWRWWWRCPLGWNYSFLHPPFLSTHIWEAREARKWLRLGQIYGDQGMDISVGLARRWGNWEYNGGASNVGSEQDVWSTVWGWSVVEMKASEDEVWTL